MDIPTVLASLRPGEDWGPCAQSDSTYAALAATWRGASPVPAEADMLAEWDRLESTRVVRAAAERRSAAVASLMTADDPVSVAVRAFVRDLYTQLNDVRQSLGLPRVLEPEIVGRVVGGIGAGLGDAPQV